jgi:ubiquinone/menaquinone biosynthesis C-methylase UbiE
MMEKNWTQTKKVKFDRNSAVSMNDIAKTVFAPIYPVIARNAVAETGIRGGLCLDLGSGPGMLAIAMARAVPELEISAFDFNEDSRLIAMENIADAGLESRIKTACGDVHAMPYEDGSVSLVVSRGSMFFWDDLGGAFREIWRVLAPGGATYIGGGFGNGELRGQVIREMAVRDPEWKCYARKMDDEGSARFRKMFADIGCRDHYRIIDDDTGMWVVLAKPE